MGLGRKAVMAVALCLLLCICVSAQSQPQITGPDTAIVGQIVELEIRIPAGEYSKVEFALSLVAGQVEICNLPTAQGWNITYADGIATAVRMEDGPLDICMELRLRILPTPPQTRILVSVQDITGYGAGEPVSMEKVSYEITVAEPPSSENFLTALVLESGTLTPAFHPDIISYSAVVSADCGAPSLVVTGAEKSKVDVFRTEFDEEGKCLITVTVTAENGSQRLYTIQVTKEKAKPTVPTVTVPQQTADSSTEDTGQSIADANTQKEEGIPGWLLVAALLAGAALGCAGAILLNERQKKGR